MQLSAQILNLFLAADAKVMRRLYQREHGSSSQQ